MRPYKKSQRLFENNLIPQNLGIIFRVQRKGKRKGERGDVTSRDVSRDKNENLKL